MPQDWFPVDSNLGEKSEIQAIVDVADLDVATVCGRMVMFWSLVDQHGVKLDQIRDGFFDGFIPGYTVKALCRLCGGEESFWLAVEQQTWIRLYPDGVGLPGFARRFSESSKMRIGDARRKQIARSKQATDERPTVPDICPEPTRQNTDYRTGQDRTGQEKRVHNPRSDRTRSDECTASNQIPNWPELDKYRGLVVAPEQPPANYSFDGSVFKPLKAAVFRRLNPIELSIWHRRQLTAVNPVVGSSVAELLLVLATARMVINKPESTIQAGRINLFCTTVGRGKWEPCRGSLEKMLEQFDRLIELDATNWLHLKTKALEQQS